MKTLWRLITKYKWPGHWYFDFIKDPYRLRDWGVGSKLSGYTIIYLGPLTIGLWPKENYGR